MNNCWDEYENYLIRTRYSIRDASGKPLEKTYDEVISRVINWVSTRLNMGIEKEEFCLTASAKNVLWTEFDCPPDEILKTIYIAINNSWSEIQKALRSRLILPATPLLMNANSPTRHSCYFSCFPLGEVPDSIDGILDYVRKMAYIYKSGGGAGADGSLLRPKNALVDNGQGLSSGPISFMSFFDVTTGKISQGGKRRGAFMFTMDACHPDILEFISCKNDNTQFPNMNISVRVDRTKLAKDGHDWSKLRRAIADSIHKSGEPGIIFTDKCFSGSLIEPEYNPIWPNPCSEYLAPKNTACNLFSLNVMLLAQNSVDFQDFYNAVFRLAYYATILGNFVLFQTDGYPLDEIAESTLKFRPVGIGMTGLHEAMLIISLYKNIPNIRYNNEFGIDFAKKTQAHLSAGSMLASIDLATLSEKITKGLVDNNRLRIAKIHQNIQNTLDYLENSLSKEQIATFKDFISKDIPIFNCNTTVQAPAGSISAFGRCSSTGIEPLFSVEYTRKIRETAEGNATDGWKEITLTPYWLDNKDYYPLIEEQCATSLTTTEHIKILQAVQDFCNCAASKTINVPHNTTVDEIEDLIKKIEDTNIKCFTLYRDGSRNVQILNKKASPTLATNYTNLADKDVAPATRYKLTGPSTCHIIVVSVDDTNFPEELFLVAGKSGSMLHSLLEGLGKAISIGIQNTNAIKYQLLKALSNGSVNKDEMLKIAIEGCEMLKSRFISTFQGIDSGAVFTSNGKRYSSIPDAIADLFEKYREAGNKTLTLQSESTPGTLCSHCGKMGVKRKGNCNTCEICGWTLC